MIHEFIISLHICDVAHYREEISIEMTEIFYSGLCLVFLINQKFSLAVLKINWAIVQLGQRQLKIPCYKVTFVHHDKHLRTNMCVLYTIALLLISI